MEGTIGDKTFKRFQDLKRYKLNNFIEPAFVEEICRGIAVNTKYSSNIQVNIFFKVQMLRKHHLKFFLIIFLRKFLYESLILSFDVSLLIERNCSYWETRFPIRKLNSQAWSLPLPLV